MLGEDARGAQSSSVAAGPVSATERKPRLSAAEFRFDRIVSSGPASRRTNACSGSAHTGAPVAVAGSIVAPAKQVLRLWRGAFGDDEVATACVHAVKNVGGGNAAELATSVESIRDHLREVIAEHARSSGKCGLCCSNAPNAVTTPLHSPPPPQIPHPPPPPPAVVV